MAPLIVNPRPPAHPPWVGVQAQSLCSRTLIVWKPFPASPLDWLCPSGSAGLVLQGAGSQGSRALELANLGSGFSSITFSLCDLGSVSLSFLIWKVRITQ